MNITSRGLKKMVFRFPLCMILNKKASFLVGEAVKQYNVRYSLNHEEINHASILADTAIAGCCLNGVLDNNSYVDYMALCKVEIR